MSILFVLLAWFPMYILSLNVFLTHVRAVLQTSATAAANETTNTAAIDKSGWLAKLGWGLGEASVLVLGSSPPESYEARIAFFGRAIPEEGISGWIVPLDSIVEPCPPSNDASDDPSKTSSSSTPSSFVPLDETYAYQSQREVDDFNLEEVNNTGCPPLCPIYPMVVSEGEDRSDNFSEASWQPFPNMTWIALVRRGTCSFAQKALYAQSLGASGLIVGGLDNNLISMSASGSTGGRINIASVFVGANSYLNLTRLIEESDVSIGVAVQDDETGFYEQQVRTILICLEGEPPWEWYTPILSLLLVLSLPSLLTLCTLLIHRIRAERRERGLRAPEDVVKGLPIRIWTGVKWEKDLECGAVGAAINARERHEDRERSPLLPVGAEVSREQEHRGYGTIVDAEPSTSAPRPVGLDIGDAPLNHVVNIGDKEVGLEDGGDGHSSAIALPHSPTQSRLLQPLPHSQEGSSESDETIPRPPWFTSQSECAICLCDFEVGDRVRVLPCGHIFHLEEVDPWLIKQRKVCPVCKYDVTNPPTALVPPSTSPPTLSALAALAGEDLNASSTPPSPSSVHPSITTTPPTSRDSTRRSQGEFAAGYGPTAAQLLNDVDERQREAGDGRGWLGWLARGRERRGEDENGS